MSLQGKVAIVTGASRGVGHYIARELAREGALLAVAARTEQESNPKLPGTIHSVAAECAALGTRAIPVHLDVTDDESIAACVRRVMDEYGRIDLVVNNAGIMSPGPFHEVPMKRIDLVFRVNVRGPWAMAREVIPHMLAGEGGVIVNISSIAGDHAGGGNVSYSVTKSADRKVAEGIADEYRGRGIRAYSLSPELLVITPGTSMHGLPDRIPADQVEAPELMGRSVIALFNDTEGRFNGQHCYSGPLLRELERQRA